MIIGSILFALVMFQKLFSGNGSIGPLDIIEVIFYAGVFVIILVLLFAWWKKKYKWLSHLVWGFFVFLLFFILVTVVFAFFQTRNDNRFLNIKAYPEDLDRNIEYYLYRSDSQTIKKELEYSIASQGKMGLMQLMKYLKFTNGKKQELAYQLLEGIPFVHYELINVYKECLKWKNINTCISRLEEANCEEKNKEIYSLCDSIRLQHVVLKDKPNEDTYAIFKIFYEKGEPYEKFYSAHILKNIYNEEIPDDFFDQFEEIKDKVYWP